MVLQLSVKATYLGKFWFKNCRSECTCPIRLQDSLTKCLLKESVNVSEFLHGSSHQGKVTFETTIFDSGWLDLPSNAQMCPD